MKRKITIQLKALFLLLVFAFNTAVGFACAIGLDMGFNTAHHHDEETTEIHVHANAEKHEHHSKSGSHHHEENTSEKKEKGGCCNDEVQKFQSLDKNLNQNAKFAIDVPLVVVLISTFPKIDIYNLSKAFPPKYKARLYYPPPEDIRIAIQRFQI
jgi:hypothetical protein